MLFDLNATFMKENYKELFIWIIYAPVNLKIKNLILRSNENEDKKTNKMK